MTSAWARRLAAAALALALGGLLFKAALKPEPVDSSLPPELALPEPAAEQDRETSPAPLAGDIFDEPPPEEVPRTPRDVRLNKARGREERSALIEQLSDMRQSIEDSESPSVPIEGRTAALLSKNAPPPSGSPVAEGEWSGPYGGSNEPGARTVSDPDSWRALWSGLSTAPAPAVDFRRDRVVAVFLGERPGGGYGVAIKEVFPTETSLIVRYAKTEPAPGRSYAAARTAPYALKIIPRGDLPVRFEEVP